MTAAGPVRASRASFAFWQALTVALLVTGYSGYYLCRSDLSVTMPLIIAEIARRGMPADSAKVALGTVASLGVLAYAIGKFPAGWLADYLGGRRNFLFGMGAAIAFTVLFGLGGGLPIWTLAWIGNRCVQSMGWSGVVKIASRWFSYSAYGSAMGIVSLSYLFGDAAAREFMARLIDAGLGWRGVFLTAAATLGLLLILNLVLLREAPGDLGFPEPRAYPANLFGDADGPARSAGVMSLLATFAKSKPFWLVCILSLGVTILRETFNLWTPTYFTQALGMRAADAAHRSALFPFFGGLSVLAAGFGGDRLGRNGRAIIILCGLLLTTVALALLAWADFGSSQTMPVALVALVAFLMIGPYSYLAGAISLDFGGKSGSATAAGLIDGIGYLGGVLSGSSVAGISVIWGWKGAFAALAAVSLLSSFAAAVYLLVQRNRQPAV